MGDFTLNCSPTTTLSSVPCQEEVGRTYILYVVHAKFLHKPNFYWEDIKVRDLNAVRSIVGKKLAHDIKSCEGESAAHVSVQCAGNLKVAVTTMKVGLWYAASVCGSKPYKCGQNTCQSSSSHYHRHLLVMNCLALSSQDPDIRRSSCHQTPHRPEPGKRQVVASVSGKGA